MRGARFVLISFAVGTVALACGSFSSTDDVAATDAGPRPPASNADAGDGASETDADAGADGSPPCSLNPIDVPFTDGRWVFRDGSGATADGGGAIVRGVTYERGQIWWGQPHLADEFEASYVVTIGPGGGDGMAFAWLNLETVPSAGGNGGNVGVCSTGNPGFAVAIDTSPTGGDTTPTLKLLDTLVDGGCPNLPITKATLAGGFPGTHPVKVTLAAGVLTVMFDGIVALKQTIAASAPASAYFGFTAANGAAAAPVTVSQVRIQFPKQPACP